jgi:hypothetical protein
MVAGANQRLNLFSMRSRLPVRPMVLTIALVVLVLHAITIWWAQGLWQPRSQIKLMAEPVYARLIKAREPAALPRPRQGIPQLTAKQPRAAISNTDAIATRPVPQSLPKPAPAPPEAAKVETKVTPKAEKVRIPAAPALKPLFAALGEDRIAPVPEPAEEIEPFADAQSNPTPSSTPLATLGAEPTPALEEANQGKQLASTELAEPTVVSTAAASPSNTESLGVANGGSNSTGRADVYQDWPQDTRINVKISGYFRGQVTGSGAVTWQREAEKYQARVVVSFGLGGFTMTSQGTVTDAGLVPSIFEESIVGRLRNARFEEDAITIGSGKRIPRAGLPGGVGAGTFQDSASQFVELAWRFATGRATLAPGATVTYWLGRPEGLYQYIYDISGPEPMNLPKFGTVNTWHLTPRPIPGLKPDAIYGEIWIAPSLQYLPVKIRMRNAQGVYLDLLVDTVEQSDQSAKLQK